jgi:SET domain-containing protein
MNKAMEHTEPEVISTPIDKKRDFIKVKKSSIQGFGVFAKKKIPKGTRIIEYLGFRTNSKDLKKDLKNGLTIENYCIATSFGVIIDGNRNGNDARFVNHSCNPNCETYSFDEKLYIYADREILRGEELTFDYKLKSMNKNSKPSIIELDKYKCNCGSENCRGIMIALKK